MEIKETVWAAVIETNGYVSYVSDLVLNHAADLWQKVLADDTVEVAVLWGGFVLDAFCQIDPLFLRLAHKGPSASLDAWWGGDVSAYRLKSKITFPWFHDVNINMKSL